MSQPLNKEDLSTRESLILVQAVYEIGAYDWDKVVQILNNHSLIQRPTSAFTPESCEGIWRAMMSESGVPFDDAVEHKRKKSIPSRKLAWAWHQKRMAELKEQIAAEEARFKTIAAEIVAIQNGDWDDKIRAMVDAKSQATELANEKSPDDVEIVEGPTSTKSKPVEPTTVSDSEPDEQETTSLLLEPPTDQRQRTEPEKQLDQANTVLDVDMAAVDEQPATSAEQQTDFESVKNEQMDDVQSSQPEERDIIPEVSGGDSKADPIEVDDEESSSREEKETSPDIPLQEVTPIPERRMTRREGKRRASEAASELSESTRERKKVREVSTVDEDSEEEDPATTKRRAQEAAKKFERVIMMLHADISNHRNGAIFQNPIKPSEAPDYHEIVKRPMDLKTMKARIKSSQILTSTEFQRDIYLMFANSMMYNRPASDIYGMAEEMMMEAEKKIQEFRQTEVLRGG